MGILSQKAKKAPVLSRGKDGTLDERRWVIITLRNSGASEAQFPLPVTVNCERISFDRDQPVVAPAFYVDSISNAVLPRYEAIQNNSQVSSNQVKSEDSHRFVGLRYETDIVEIPEQYQTIETIESFVDMVHSDECPPEFASMRNIIFGQTSFSQHNYNYSNLVKSKAVAKATVATGKGGSSNNK